MPTDLDKIKINLRINRSNALRFALTASVCMITRSEPERAIRDSASPPDARCMHGHNQCTNYVKNMTPPRTPITDTGHATAAEPHRLAATGSCSALFRHRANQSGGSSSTSTSSISIPASTHERRAVVVARPSQSPRRLCGCVLVLVVDIVRQVHGGSTLLDSGRRHCCGCCWRWRDRRPLGL